MPAATMTAPLHANTSVPVAMYGKDVEVAKAVCQELMPEYESMCCATR